MARLPVVGGDKDAWAGILNEFLQVEHDTDGTLKRLNQPDGICPLDSNGLVPSDNLPTHAVGGYSAIVYIDGSSIIAEDYKGNTLASGTAGTDDASVINSAITHVNEQLSNGFERGIIFGRGLTYNLGDTIILKTGVILKDFYFYLKDGTNKDVIKTENFDTLTGGDTGCADSSVPHDFGLIDVVINGNKDNNTSGSGLKMYACGYILDRVTIRECAEHGFWFEGGGGWGDRYGVAFENWIGHIYACFNGGHGIVHKGATDTVFGKIITHDNGNHGMYVTSPRGNCDILHIHSYGNGGDGLNAEGLINLVYGELESNQGKGLSMSSVWYSTIGTLFSYANHDIALYLDQVSYTVINSAILKDNQTSTNTLYVHGMFLYMNVVLAYNEGTDLCKFNYFKSSKINIRANANDHTGKAIILGTTENGIQDNIINAQIWLKDGNSRILEIHSGGRNKITLRGWMPDANHDWDYSTYPPHSTDEIDYKTNTLTYTLPEKTGSATIANGNTSVTVNHKLPATPTNIQLTGTHSEVKDAYVTNVGATSFDIVVGSAVTANRTVYWKARV